MRFLFACGGTAGHINPAIAIADTLIKRYPNAEILFVGNPKRMEADLVPKAGYSFTPLVVEGFYRSFSPKSIIHNVKSVYYMFSASVKAKEIITRFNPSVVIGTGGYVSGPVLRTAAKMGIKTITHESNAFPGVTTKLLVKHVDKVLLAFEDAKKHLPDNINYIVTGNPVRPSIFTADRDASRRALGIKGRFCILSYGGSNGALNINNAVAELIAKIMPERRTHHIHAFGRIYAESFPLLLEQLGIEANCHLDIRTYISDMDNCLAAADLVICRAGAMALSEIEAIGKASILIPSPNVAENHQYHNAMVLGSRYAAVVIEEKDLTGDILYNWITDLIDDPLELSNMEKNAKSLGIINSAEMICDEIIKLYSLDRIDA